MTYVVIETPYSFSSPFYDGQENGVSIYIPPQIMKKYLFTKKACFCL